MGFKCGIVGLPNVGKSTLFNALTQSGIEAANYPFCTIEPNVGMVSVPDPRLNDIAALVNPQKIIPATMEFVDIAGLVKGAAEGEGLGNQFLSHIRETDAIAHVVRCFEDTDITHVSGTIDPLDDIEVIETELLLADMASTDKAVERTRKQAKSGDKTAKAMLACYERLKAHLDGENPARTFEPSNEQEHSFVTQLCLITRKPVMYIANVAEDGFADNPLLAKVEAFAKTVNAEVVPVCAAIESEIAQLSEEEQTEFLSEMNLEEPGLNRVIRQGYQLLALHTYFTAGEKEVRAWTIPLGATAPQAAGKIHTDFERGFIRAEVTGYEDFIAHKGFAGAKEAGKWRLEGKDYVVHDGDIIVFRFNV